MKTEKKAGKLKFLPADKKLVQKLDACWPLGVKKYPDESFHRLIMQANDREIWGIRSMSAQLIPMDILPGIIEYLRTIIPLALSDVVSDFDGTMIPGFCIEESENSARFGLVVYAALSSRRSENMGAVPPAIPGFLKASSVMGSDIVREKVLRFIHLFNRYFSEIIQQKHLFASISAYPDGMMGYNCEFMAINGKLACLHEQPQENDPCWDLIAEFTNREVIHLPLKFAIHNDDPAYNYNFEDFYATNSYFISPDNLQIVVPGLIGNIIPDEYSIGWDGCVTFAPVGIDRILRIDPHMLTKFERQVLREDKTRNLELWENRAVAAQNELGWRGLILVKDQITSYDDAVESLKKALKAMIREAKRNASPAMLKGVKKPVKRSLEGLIQSPQGVKAKQMLESLESATSPDEILTVAADIKNVFELEINEKTKNAAPVQNGPLEFIYHNSLKLKKLQFLYQIACNFCRDRIYSRSEVEFIVKYELENLNNSQKYDPRFSIDVLIRNLIDVKYLDRNPHTNEYWLIAKTAKPNP